MSAKEMKPFEFAELLAPESRKFFRRNFELRTEFVDDPKAQFAYEYASCFHLTAEQTAALGTFICRRTQCTGVAARWCPVHGDCTCPFGDGGIEEENPECPLHGRSSGHCEEGSDQ